MSQSGQALLNQFSQQNQPTTGSPSLSFSLSQAPPLPPLQPPVLSSQQANAALVPQAPQALLPQALLPQALLPQALLPQALLPQALLPQALLPQALLPQALLPQAQPLSTAGLQFLVPQQQSQPLAQLELQSSLPAPSQPSVQTETQVEGSSSYPVPSTKVHVIHPLTSGSFWEPPPALAGPSECWDAGALGTLMLASVASNTSSGSQGHPHITMAPGFPALTAIQCSNQTRMGHTSVSLPQSSSKARKTWGRAIQPPRLGTESPKLDISDCVRQAVGGEDIVNLDVLVYPLMPDSGDLKYYGSPKQELVGYVWNTESINMVLSSLNIFHEFPNLPITTCICDIFATITEKLKEHYVISEPPQLPSGMAFPTQDQLPLQILAWTNCGHANGKYKTPKLTTASFCHALYHRFHYLQPSNPPDPMHNLPYQPDNRPLSPRHISATSMHAYYSPIPHPAHI
ncbi:hypothetical protein BT96DRAFT_1004954 [Gymnopus androsaceus JB14]|uniref:Uncharacterized protein n=1 Tax=Gymnopus androsaceus JB14 TaxID=1447944 RepID=A0A6A4GQG3_9AGAR|nr:hypothetical protein BT96DRAFT_1004954 [Gymnopus androsaceus JB14]